MWGFAAMLVADGTDIGGDLLLCCMLVETSNLGEGGLALALSGMFCWDSGWWWELLIYLGLPCFFLVMYILSLHRVLSDSAQGLVLVVSESHTLFTSKLPYVIVLCKFCCAND